MEIRRRRVKAVKRQRRKARYGDCVACRHTKSSHDPVCWCGCDDWDERGTVVDGFSLGDTLTDMLAFRTRWAAGLCRNRTLPYGTVERDGEEARPRRIIRQAPHTEPARWRPTLGAPIFEPCGCGAFLRDEEEARLHSGCSAIQTVQHIRICRDGKRIGEVVFRSWSETPFRRVGGPASTRDTSSDGFSWEAAHDGPCPLGLDCDGRAFKTPFHFDGICPRCRTRPKYSYEKRDGSGLTTAGFCRECRTAYYRERKDREVADSNVTPPPAKVCPACKARPRAIHRRRDGSGTYLAGYCRECLAARTRRAPRANGAAPENGAAMFPRFGFDVFFPRDGVHV